MEHLFALYLVLADKPRFDDTNIVQTNLTQEQCEEASGVYNGASHAMNLGASPKYLWACGPAPDEIDHHEDLLHPAKWGN